MEEDIRETGIGGLRYDSSRGLGNQIGGTNPLLPYIYKSGENVNRLANLYASPSKEEVGTELSELGFGESQYDKEATNMFQAEHLNEFRAQQQPWYDQIANGALKMVTTAGTTFVDGTLGTLWGIGTGVTNWFDDDPNTGFWRGMWDNAVTNAMADINDAMEKVATNYRSEWEQNASVFERMFSSSGAANFWGDDILKNAGFTIGAAASIYATSALGNALKGISGVGRAGEGLGLLTRGAQGLEATDAGKAASWIAKTFASTQGEAAIETLNATRESLKALDAETALMKQRGEEAIRDEFKANVEEGMDIETALALSRDRAEQLNSDIEAYNNHAQEELSKAGNMIYAANIAALSASNNLTLGSMIRGGYGNAKSLLSQSIKTAGGKPINTIEEAGRALLKGDLRFAAPEVSNKAAKAAAYWALTSTQEGLEEGVQNLASNTGQIVSSARTHQWAKDNTMLDTLVNMDAEEDLTTYSAALGKAYEEQFGHLNSPGWTEVVAGFITGALGVPGMHMNSENKLRPTWNGGFVEALEHVSGNQKAVQAQADALNRALTDNKFGERARHAVQQLAIKKSQEDALERGDVRAYKNFEIQQLLSDAVFFKDMGMLDDYLAMYEAMSSDITDQDVAELRAMAKQEDGKASYLETISDDEVKSTYKDKAESTLDKVKKALDDHKAMDDMYGDKFSEETRRDAIMEMTYLNTLYWDTQRRAGEVEDELEALKNKKRTPIEDSQLRLKEAALKSLEKQATDIREGLNVYKNNPEVLQRAIEKKQLDRQKRILYKKAEEAIAQYKGANTFQEIADVFNHSPLEDKEQVLNQAIEQSEGETKEKLQQFKNYMGDINTLEHILEDKFPLDDEKTAYVNSVKLAELKRVLNGAIEEMLSDETPILSRDTLKDKLNKIVERSTEELEEATREAGGVKVFDDGTYDFSEAIDSGEIDEKTDFKRILDDEDSGESHLEIASFKAERMAEAAREARGIQNFIDEVNNLASDLDKLDELREAGKKKKAEKKVSKKGKHVTVEEEVIEGEEDNSEDSDESEGTFNFDDEDEGNPDEVAAPAESKPDTSKFLTDEEKATYSVKPKEGKFGITYNTVKKHGPENLKAKESVGRKFNKTEDRLQAKLEGFRVADKKRKQVIIQDILDIVKNNLISNKTMKEVEDFFQANSKYLKTTSGEEEALPSYEEEGLSSTDVSMNGNQYAAYVKSELKNGKMVPVTHQKSGAEPMQVWLNNEGYNTQEIIDNHLGKVIARDAEKAVKDKTPIHYLHNNTHPDAVFLGVEYSKVEDVIPRTVARKLVKGQDGKDYLLVGTFGWEAARKGTEDMYQVVLDSMKDSEHTSDGWHVNTEHANRIKDFQSGEVVKQTTEDSEPKVRDLRELLSDPERNPSDLKIDNLGWTVIEGSEKKPTRKIINGDASKTYTVRGGKPGQVYLNMPASNGNFVPVYIETIFLDELEEGTPLYNEIEKHLEILANPNNTMQDKESAREQLNDLLIFSPVNRIHLNDESNKLDPNTIYVTKDGQPTKVLDFNEPISAEAALALLTEAVYSVNPRINLSTSILDRNPSLYLNSGALKTDVALLGTVNSSFFLFPVDNNGEYVENKPFKGTGKTYDASTRNRIYVGGKYVYYDGSKFTDAYGSKIEDEDGTLAAALKIKNGKVKPIKVGRSRANYYVVDDTVYVDNGHGGINEVDAELRDKVLSASKNKSAHNSRKESSKKEAEKIKKKKENAPVEDERLKAETPEVDEEGDDWDESEDDNKTSKDEKPKKSNFTNGTDIDGVKSQAELEAEAASSTFATVLAKRENKAKKKELYGLIESKFGKKVTNNAEAVAELMNGHGLDLSSNDLDTVIQEVKSCR